MTIFAIKSQLKSTMADTAPKTYTHDVCFISFSEPFTDGRTLNIVKLTAKLGKSVCLIAIGNENDARNLKGHRVQFYNCEKSTHSKASVRWTKFKADAKKYYNNITAKFYYACDLYSLPITNDLKKQSTFMGAHSKMIYDSREIYSELGTYEGRGIKQAILSQAEKMYVKNVNKMVTSGPFDSIYLKEYFRHNLPYTEILNLPPYQAAVKSDLLRKKLKFGDNDLIVIYQGMLMKGRGILPAIKAIQKLDDVRLVIVGQGDYYPELKQYVDSNNLARKVIFAGLVPYMRLHEITCSADVGLALFEPISKSYELALPNKLFEYIIANKPSVVTNLQQMENVINKEEVGILVDQKCDPEEIADKIAYLQLHQNRQPYIEKCKKVAKNYGFESQKEKIQKLFD
ncbi:glycosyltransferase [Candidatus Kapabacteria bacterium]|nr:glycosyltransferase [Candidatus Kapabacteria bacterium]